MPAHTVTVTRMTTTTTSTSAIILNTGYFKNLAGILKLLQLILCIVIVGIMSYYLDNYTYFLKVDVFMLVVGVACMVTTFVLLLSCLISIATASILPKTTFEYLYHFFAFLLLLVAGIAVLAEHVRYHDTYRQSYNYEAKVATAVIALVAAGLYLVSTIMAYRVYRVG